ncbi:hypothetical protein FQN50_003568 [Emmonsiellopsis sp. PD_5]|nr:hypothetical protein FQN50_003568 [Emmonsiellopsis sp. PD_5]
MQFINLPSKIYNSISPYLSTADLNSLICTSHRLKNKFHSDLLLRGKTHTVEDVGSVLHWAAMYDRCDLAIYLLKCGLSASVTDKRHRTPLHVAARRGSVNVAILLLANGANVNAVDSLGFTPILDAAANCQTSMLKLFISAGADISRSLPPLGPFDVNTALTLAIRPPWVCDNKREAAEAVQILLEAGAVMPVGRFPSYVLANLLHHRLEPLIDLLFDYSADVEQAAYYALKYCHMNLFGYLIRHGYKPENEITSGVMRLAVEKRDRKTRDAIHAWRVSRPR